MDKEKRKTIAFQLFKQNPKKVDKSDSNDRAKEFHFESTIETNGSNNTRCRSASVATDHSPPSFFNENEPKVSNQPIYCSNCNSKITKELKTQVSELQSQVEGLKTIIDKLSLSEYNLKERIQNLELRERDLLKSCEKLQEVNETSPNNNVISPTTATSSIFRKKKVKVKSGEDNEPEQLRIDTKDIQIYEQLGTGASGATVSSVIIDGWTCAMKELSRTSTNSVDEESFEREMSLLYQLPKHPNIVRYLYHRKLKGKYCLFMTKYTCTLKNELDKRSSSNDHLSLELITRTAAQIVNGLCFLHSNNIIHRDLKCDNIFINLNRLGIIRDVAIGDFDTARRIGVSELPKSTVGTQGFIAPEVLNACRKTAYSYSADIFSFAMVLYEMMALKYPYHELNSPIEVSAAILKGKIPFLPPNLADKYSLIVPIWKKCLSVDPEQRYTAIELQEEFTKISQQVDVGKFQKPKPVEQINPFDKSKLVPLRPTPPLRKTPIDRSKNPLSSTLPNAINMNTLSSSAEDVSSTNSIQHTKSDVNDTSKSPISIPKSTSIPISLAGLGSSMTQIPLPPPRVKPVPPIPRRESNPPPPTDLSNESKQQIGSAYENNNDNNNNNNNNNLTSVGQGNSVEGAVRTLPPVPKRT